MKGQMDRNERERAMSRRKAEVQKHRAQTRVYTITVCGKTTAVVRGENDHSAEAVSVDH
jgi:hypothetical protein